MELEEHSKPGSIRGAGKLTFRVPEAEYEALLLQFADGVIVTLEETQNRHVAKRVGGGVKTVGDQKVLLFVANRAQMLYKMVSESTLGLTTETVRARELEIVNVVEGIRGIGDVGGQGLDMWRQDRVK
eukprot:g47025.t1